MPEHGRRRGRRRQKATVTLNDLELQADRRRRDSSWTTLATTSGAVARQNDPRAKQGRAAEERRQRRRDMRAERELRAATLQEREPVQKVSFAHSVFSRHAAQFAATTPQGWSSRAPTASAAKSMAGNETCAELQGETNDGAASTPEVELQVEPANQAKLQEQTKQNPAPMLTPEPEPEPEPEPGPEPETQPKPQQTAAPKASLPDANQRSTLVPALAYLGSASGSFNRISSLGSNFRLSMDERGGLGVASATTKQATVLSSADAETMRAIAVSREHARKVHPSPVTAQVGTQDKDGKLTRLHQTTGHTPGMAEKIARGNTATAMISRRQADRALQLRKLALKREGRSTGARTSEAVQPDSEDDVTCGVCFELYEIPYRGECGHTICGGCLERLPRTDCPFCRAPLAEPATLGEIAEGTA